MKIGYKTLNVWTAVNTLHKNNYKICVNKLNKPSEVLIWILIENVKK